MRIKVKILNMYRECELLHAYRGRLTGIVRVDVRVIAGRVPQGHGDHFYAIAITHVRKSDRAAVESTIPPAMPAE